MSERFDGFSAEERGILHHALMEHLQGFPKNRAVLKDYLISVRELLMEARLSLGEEPMKRIRMLQEPRP